MSQFFRELILQKIVITLSVYILSYTATINALISKSENITQTSKTLY